MYLLFLFLVLIIGIVREFLSDWRELVHWRFYVIIPYKPICQEGFVSLIAHASQNLFEFYSTYLRRKWPVTIFLSKERLQKGIWQKSYTLVSIRKWWQLKQLQLRRWHPPHCRMIVLTAIYRPILRSLLKYFMRVYCTFQLDWISTIGCFVNRTKYEQV